MSRQGPQNLPDRPCNVLHFVSTFQVKTDTKWLAQVARHLDRDAFRMHIACFHEAGPMQEQFESLGVRTYNLESPYEHDPRAILRAKRLIADIRPQIVHTHLLRADLFGGMAARLARVPVILSTVYAIGQFRRSRKRKSDRILDMACASLPTHVLAVSESVKRDCVERLQMDSNDVTVIHTGIDPPATMDADAGREIRRQWQIGDDQPLIVTLARLSYEKGIDTLIDAASIIRQTNPNVRFVVVGDGPDRETLEDRICAKNLTGIIRLAGFAQDVWPALTAADIVCMPSKSEGMPNALLEAMSAERPVVATNVGGIPEAIRHEENGLLVSPEDARELAFALRRVVDNRDLARRLSAAAKATILERFHAKDVVARYAALYEQLLNATRSDRDLRTGVN